MTTTTPSNEVAGQDGVPHLTRRDYISTYIRSTFMLGSFNFERMQAIGVCVTMMPAIRRFYTKKEDQAAALTRHLEFYNTHPWISSSIFGVTAAMERQKAAGEDISDADITNVKIGLMGPLAGVGDPLFWGTARPVFAALGASIAADGNILGPLLFFFGLCIIRMATRWYGFKLGYEKGVEIVSEVGGNTLRKLTQTASIMGLFVMGSLVSKWTTINIPVALSCLAWPPCCSLSSACGYSAKRSTPSGSSSACSQSASLDTGAASLLPDPDHTLIACSPALLLH